MGSTTSSTSAAITAPPASIEPPGPKPFRPGPQSPAWPLGHKPSWDRPSCALSRPEPIKLTVPLRLMQPNRIDDPGHSDLRQHAIPPAKTGQIVCYETRTYLVSPTQSQHNGL